MADKLKPFTAGELAKQAAKELLSGAFSSKGKGDGAAKNASSVLRARKNQPEGLSGDTNPYHSRQHTDDSNP